MKCDTKSHKEQHGSMRKLRRARDGSCRNEALSLLPLLLLILHLLLLLLRLLLPLLLLLLLLLIVIRRRLVMINET